VVTNPFDEPSIVHFDDGGNEEIDSGEAAAILGVTVNNLRQITHKKLLTVIRHEKRKAMFRANDVRQLKVVREQQKQARDSKKV